ncbi:MAG: hypothetical protein ACREI7_09150 [Myxococcota bacterium]
MSHLESNRGVSHPESARAVSWQAPNLAREPFLNQRPLLRASTALALAAVVLTGANAVSYLRAGSGAEATARELVRLERAGAETRSRLATLERDLAQFDLAALNRRAAFVNDRIEERSFSWNLLFTRLAEALPRGVRLASVSPRFGDDGRKGGARRGAEVVLHLRGEAEDGEALLEFVDSLFEHPAFDRPDLNREGQSKGAMTSFDLTVSYLPEPER